MIFYINRTTGDLELVWFGERPIGLSIKENIVIDSPHFLQSLTRKINERVAIPDQRSIYQVGETYGSPELINSYVKSGLLDGQFDFNLYDATIHAFVNEDGNIHRLLQVLKESLNTYGSHHLMANITGNQDKVRFMSYADGSVAFEEDP